MSDRVITTIENGVAEVRLNRADKLNALDSAMFHALVEAGEALKSKPEVRVVVLSADGRGFCAGLDFSSFQAMADDDRGDAAGGSNFAAIPDGRITHLGQQACWVWQELEVPVIAAVHGVAFGGGFQLTLGADIRIVAPDVRMSVLEIRWGLTPDMTATQILPHLVGPDQAKLLAWTGREVNGAEAVELGLATSVADDPATAARELAADIASRNPHAVRGTKHLINLALGHDWAHGFAEERRVIDSIIGSPNQVEAVTAFFQKRDAVYADIELDSSPQS